MLDTVGICNSRSLALVLRWASGAGLVETHASHQGGAALSSAACCPTYMHDKSLWQAEHYSACNCRLTTVAKCAIIRWVTANYCCQPGLYFFWHVHKQTCTVIVVQSDTPCLCIVSLPAILGIVLACECTGGQSAVQPAPVSYRNASNAPEMRRSDDTKKPAL